MLIDERRSKCLSSVGFIVTLVLSVSSVSYAHAGTITRFTVVDSSPSSWVARGYHDYTVSPDVGWTFTPGRNFDNGVSFWISGAPLQGTTVNYWRLNFAAPFDALITPGFYPDFQRFPFQGAGRPGLEFASTGRLDNEASGFFEVFEATYGPAGQVLSFSADFTHYGETNPRNYAVVEVRYNAIPEPGGAMVVLVGVPFVLRRRRNGGRRTQSTSLTRPSPRFTSTPTA